MWLCEGSYHRTSYDLLSIIALTKETFVRSLSFWVCSNYYWIKLYSSVSSEPVTLAAQLLIYRFCCDVVINNVKKLTILSLKLKTTKWLVKNWNYHCVVNNVLQCFRWLKEFCHPNTIMCFRLVFCLVTDFVSMSSSLRMYQVYGRFSLTRTYNSILWTTRHRFKHCRRL